MFYSVAMNDNLYQAFHAFKHGREHNKRLIEKLLHMYKPPHITNAAQLDRLGIKNNPLKMQLLQNSLSNQSLTELCLKTDYKVLLADMSNHMGTHIDFPRHFAANGPDPTPVPQ